MQEICEKVNIVSLFGGIECGYEAFRQLKIDIDNYYSSEIDKYAIGIAKYNHPNIKELGDITLLDEDKLKMLPKIDWVMGGSPCQSFSLAGNQSGFEGKSGLFYEYLRVLKWIKENNNKDVKFLLENVKMKKEWQNQITNSLKTVIENTFVTEINSKLVSAQNRPRIYWTNFSVLQPIDRNLLIKDIATDTDYKEPSLKRINYIQGRQTKGFCKGIIDNLYTKAPCLTAVMYKSLKDQTINQNGVIRFLTPMECERLQTLPDNYTKYGIFNNVIKEISDTQRYKTIGNGWTVEVIKHIIKDGM